MKELEKFDIERDNKIFCLLLEGIYLPIESKNNDLILSILKQRDFARLVLKYYYGEFSLKSIGKFLAKESNSILKYDYEISLHLLFSKLQNYYDSSCQITKSFENLIYNKAEINEFKEIIDVAEKSNLVYKFYYYLPFFNDYSNYTIL